MQKTYDLYKRGIAFWYLLLIPLIAFGFYKSYFIVLLAPRPSIVHIHFILMMLWTGLLIIQPLLIRYKKIALHRSIGKTSYIIVPLLLIAGFFMIRFSYYRNLNEINNQLKQGTLQVSAAELLQQAADFVRITYLYLFWLGFFYFKAIINRHTTSVHARYMVAASLTMLGPTVDRIIYFYTGIINFFGVIPLEYLSFLLQDIILAGLLIYDYKKGKPTKTLWVCLLTYIIGQFLYYFVEHKAFWETFVSFTMQPAP